MQKRHGKPSVAFLRCMQPALQAEVFIVIAGGWWLVAGGW
jgi:hypothetical protein